MYWGINLKLAAYATAAVFLFVSGWVINGWRYDGMYLKMYKNAQNVQNTLQNQLDNERVKKNAEIKSINAKHDAVVKQLRNRTSRSAADTQNGKTCTGAELLKEDAEFLVGEAARADEVVAELNYCHSNYENARKLLGK